MTSLSEKAKEIGLAYGPALTKAAGGDLVPFQEYVPSYRETNESFK